MEGASLLYAVLASESFRRHILLLGSGGNLYFVRFFFSPKYFVSLCYYELYCFLSLSSRFLSSNYVSVVTSLSPMPAPCPSRWHLDYSNRLCHWPVFSECYSQPAFLNHNFPPVTQIKNPCIQPLQSNIQGSLYKHFLLFHGRKFQVIWIHLLISYLFLSSGR